MIIVFSGLVLALLSPLFFIGFNLVNDINFRNADKIDCIMFSSLSWAESGGVISRSRLNIQTKNSYYETAEWYENRGWWCDGSCQKSRTIVIGPFKFDTFKYFDAIPLLSSFEPGPPYRFDLYESFSLQITQD